MGGPRFVRAATPTWLHANVKARTAYLTLIASWSDANGGLNFDGYSNGKMVVNVPLGWHVQVTFSNRSAAPHSVEVIVYHTPVPETDSEPPSRMRSPLIPSTGLRKITSRSDLPSWRPGPAAT
jgi:hypothetical protein